MESRTEHPSTPYTTLGHRWGNEKFTILTSETIGYFQSGVDFDDFPATFKDAMEVTRQLGFEYIWIDCFCIIQEVTDWANEAPQMSEVYSSGILNIGAAHSNGPTGGCFASRGELSLEARPLYVNWRNPKDRQLRLSTLRPRTEKYDFDGWDIGEAPISKRACVVQERHLCTGMLYYGRTQLYWKCRSSGNVNELWPDPQPKPPQHPSSEGPGPGTFHLELNQASLAERRTIAGQLWTAALTEFTECALSVASDKLPAIQGIADRISELSASPYTNGVFAFSLPKSLCWENAYHTSAKLRDYRWRAPSWSWASVEGVIRYLTDSLLPESGELLACVLAPTGPALVCIGKLFAIVEEDAGESPIYNPLEKRFSVEGHVGALDHIHTLFEDLTEEASHESGARRFCLPLYGITNYLEVLYTKPTWPIGRVRDEDSQCVHVVYCLALARNGDGTYRRIGVCRMFFISTPPSSNPYASKIRAPDLHWSKGTRFEFLQAIVIV